MGKMLMLCWKFGLRAAVALAAMVLVTGCGGPEVRSLATKDKDGSLTLVTGTFNRSCDESNSIIFECGRWELRVNLEPDAWTGEQPLASQLVWAESLVSDGEPDGNECLVQGGTFEQGTIELTVVTDTLVSFDVAGTAVGAFNADGSYEAEVCP